jgi:hypothetical protein
MSIPNITLPGGSGIPAVGSILNLLVYNSPQTYKPVGNMGNLKWGMKTMDADTTNQGTIWKQGIPTLNDGGTITGDLHMIPASAGADYNANTLEGHSFDSGLGNIMINREVRQWRLDWPDGSGIYFSAYFTEYPVDMNLEKDMEANITLKVTGEVVPF